MRRETRGTIRQDRARGDERRKKTSLLLIDLAPITLPDGVLLIVLLLQIIDGVWGWGMHGNLDAVWLEKQKYNNMCICNG